MHYFFVAITTYEIPSGHSNYGPPLRPTTLSSATHGYLPPSGAGGSSTSSAGGGTYSIYGGHGAHAAFESPSHNYLPSGYGLDGAYIIYQPKKYLRLQINPPPTHPPPTNYNISSLAIL